MFSSPIVTAVYGLILALILLVNILYFFQIFKYRLPGDASIFIVIIHVAVMIFILVVGGLLMSS